MAKKLTEYEVREALLKYQLDGLRARFERKQRRDAFVKKNLKKIIALKMDGWPRMKQMPHYMEWLDLVYKAKLEGVYSLGTANCDVIAQLNRFAQEFKNK